MGLRRQQDAEATLRRGGSEVDLRAVCLVRAMIDDLNGAVDNEYGDVSDGWMVDIDDGCG